MSPICGLVDKAKEMCSARNDSELARRLGVTPSSVSNWRRSKNYPDAVTCGKIAEITGIPLARVLGIVGEARAISREEKAVWRRLASAAVVAGLTLSTLPVWGNHTGNMNESRVYTLCEVRRLARFLSAKMRRLSAGRGTHTANYLLCDR